MSGGGGETERASESGSRLAWAGAIPFDEARLGRVTPDSAVDDAIATIPPGGRVNSRDEGAERILGWGEYEIVGRPAAPFFTDEDDDRVKIGTEMRSAREEGPAADERYHGREDGSRFHAQGLMMPPRGPGAAGANGLQTIPNRERRVEGRTRQSPSGRRIGMIYDVTERRRDEVLDAAVIEFGDRPRDLDDPAAMSALASEALGVAVQSPRHARDLSGGRARVTARPGAPGRAQGMPVGRPGGQVDIHAAIADEMAPQQGEAERVTMEGRRVTLFARQVLGFGLAVHEIGRDAGKFGALSSGSGRVSVRWTMDDAWSGKRRTAPRPPWMRPRAASAPPSSITSWDATSRTAPPSRSGPMAPGSRSRVASIFRVLDSGPATANVGLFDRQN